MSAQRLANRYAKSILDLAQEQGVTEAVFADMKGIHQSLRDSRELQLMFKSPVISPSKKQSIFDAVFKGKLNPVVENFFNIIIRKRREGYIEEIVNAFLEQYNSNNGITSATITTAAAVDNDVLEKIRQFVAKETNSKSVELHTEVDEALIGGFILRFEDKLYNASVADKLRKLRKSFSNN